MERSTTQLVVGVAMAAAGAYIFKAQPGGEVYGWGFLLLGIWYATSLHPLIWDGLLDIITWTREVPGWARGWRMRMMTTTERPVRR